jgi:hypothetical protein
MKPGPKKGAKYTRRKPLVEKRCETCGRKFRGLLKRGRYCSTRCRDTAAKRRLRGNS